MKHREKDQIAMDKTLYAVVVGGGSSLGRESALALARRGVRVALIDESFDGTSPELNELVAQGNARISTCSFEDIPAICAAIDEAAEQFGGIDILVNCVFEAGPDGVWDVPEDAWQRCIRVNMKLPFFALQACVPYMRARGGGRVVNMSSVLGAVTDGHHQVVFGMAKAGLNSMTRQWAVDLSPENIQANSLWVGYDDPDAIPSPREVAAFVAFVALDATPYLNGAQIPVDAGASLLRQGALVHP